MTLLSLRMNGKYSILCIECINFQLLLIYSTGYFTTRTSMLRIFFLKHHTRNDKNRSWSFSGYLSLISSLIRISIYVTHINIRKPEFQEPLLHPTVRLCILLQLSKSGGSVPTRVKMSVCCASVKQTIRMRLCYYY